MSELDLFAAAVAMSDPAQRIALLDRECVGQPHLRTRIDQLLEIYFKSPRQPQSLDPVRASIQSGTTVEYLSEDVEGRVIAGKYKLRHQIAKGGMGTVWMADQTEPVQRRVAVKFVRVDRPQSQTILARFEAERQAIALMDHPHIARLFDAGATETGSPFFVMELIQGVPLTEFCDHHKLSMIDRLALFAEICSAVHHAHQKGIIHRDLKPSNILVESHDGKPAPKVIDFGLAKATNDLQLSDHTLFTAFGTVLGTPQYMAPEQADFDAVDVDTRADLYALGVILYELLTGTTPLTRAAIKKAPLDEMLKLIREQEAPTPSSRLNSGDSQPSIAANRRMEPAKLGRFVRGELDWIVLKALSKERDRRYESASEFAKDVERFLNHEPVSAGPPTAAYRLRKFVRRYRPQVVAASLILFALAAGIVGTTTGLIWAIGERNDKEQARKDAVENEAKARALAKKERTANVLAQERLKQIEKANEILASIFRDLNPRNAGPTPWAKLEERFERAAKDLAGEVDGDPVTIARLQHSLGRNLLELGHYGSKPTLLDTAQPLLESACQTMEKIVGAEHSETLASKSSLGMLYYTQGKLDLAEPLIREVLKRREATLGSEHLMTLDSKGDLALLLSTQRKFDQAESLYREILSSRTAQRVDHSFAQHIKHNLAWACLSQGKFKEAEPLFREAAEAARNEKGLAHLDTQVYYQHLIECYAAMGQPAKAEPLHRQLAEFRKQQAGADSIDYFRQLNALAENLLSQEKWAEAEPIMRECLAFREKRGPDEWQTFLAKSLLGGALLGQMKYDEAESLLLSGYKGMKDRERFIPHAGEHWLPEAVDRLIDLYTDTNRHDDARNWKSERAKYPDARSIDSP